MSPVHNEQGGIKQRTWQTPGFFLHYHNWWAENGKRKWMSGEVLGKIKYTPIEKKRTFIRNGEELVVIINQLSHSDKLCDGLWSCLVTKLLNHFLSFWSAVLTFTLQSDNVTPLGFQTLCNSVHLFVGIKTNQQVNRSIKEIQAAVWQHSLNLLKSLT